MYACKHVCMYIFIIYVCIYFYIFDGRPAFNPRFGHTKDSKKWYLIPPCLAHSTIRQRSTVKWSNPDNGVALPLSVVAIEKGSLRVSID